MMTEYTQTDDKIVFEPLMASKLGRNEKERRYILAIGNYVIS